LTGVRERLDMLDNQSKSAFYTKLILGDKGIADLLPSIFKDKEETTTA